MNKQSILYRSPLDSGTGYGETSRSIFFSLHNTNNYKIRLNTFYGSPQKFKFTPEEERIIREADKQEISLEETVSIQIITSVHYEPISRWNIGYGMFETDRIPSDWVDSCNRMNAIVVPSKFNADTFKGSGVKVPIYVAPNGMTLQDHHVTSKPFSMFLDKFSLLCVGAVHHRKGWDVIFDSFLRAFPNRADVRLIVKPFIEHPPEVEYLRALVQQARAKTGNYKAEIVMINRFLSESDMSRLFKTASALVSPFRGEAWGYTVFHAASCGVPVISTGWSSPCEYLNYDNSYPIPYKLVPVSNMDHNSAYLSAQLDGNHLWAEPDPDGLSQLMQHVYNNPTEALLKATKAKSALKNLSWEKCGKVFDQVIREVVKNG